MDMEFFECACGYVCSEDLTNLSWWCIHVVVVLCTCSACCTGVCVCTPVHVYYIHVHTFYRSR